MRSAIQVSIEGTVLQGTCHLNGGRPPAHSSQTTLARGRIGILSTNAGYQPRASQGDLASHLADYTAALGFPSFRFDMPGVGDSEGELDREVLPFHELIQEGRHVSCHHALRKALIEKYSLAGTVFIGHCGSASTAVYEADQHPSEDQLGLILLEPTFIWYRAPGKARPGEKRSSLAAANDRLKSWRQKVRAKLVQQPGGEKLTLAYAKLVNAARSFKPRPLPADSNERLIKAYRRLLAKKVPILVLTAPPVVKRPDYFDYLGYVLAGRHYDDFSIVPIEGASHSLLEAGGEQAVFAAITQWLRERFPGHFAAAEHNHR